MESKAGWVRKSARANDSDAWNRVKIQCAPAVAKQPGQTAWSAERTSKAVLSCLKEHFGNDPRAAARSQAAYLAWARNAEEVAERLGGYPPLTEGAKRWKRFADDMDGSRVFSAAAGNVWAHVNANDGIDFRPALRRSRGRSM
jgi:hypothetical protein